MLQEASILGASGAMGTLFARRLSQSGCAVTGLDIRPPADRADFKAFVQVDVAALNESAREILCASQCVIICLPHDPGLAAIGRLVQVCGPEALIVDTLSIKAPVADRLRSLNLSCEYLSINPMFAPSVGFEHQAVAAVKFRDGECSGAFLKLLESWGAHVVTMPADEHDRACAAMQAATHAAILALAQVCAAGFKIEDLLKIAPPPFLITLSLAARITSAAPETYWDIQRHNPHASALRRELISALTDLDAAVGADDFARFARALESVRQSFGGQLDRLTTTAAEAIRGAGSAH